jgi:uncharacterized Tic20 family protein
MATEPLYHPLPQPDEIPTREKEDAMGAYFMMFAALAAGLPLPVINLIAALIYYYVNRRKSPFVHFHSLQSLISQLPTSILNIIAVFWTVRIFITEGDFTRNFFGYLIMVGIANLIYIAFSIVGAVYARKGRMFYFLLFGPLSYKVAFRVREVQNKTFENQPPRL